MGKKKGKKQKDLDLDDVEEVVTKGVDSEDLGVPPPEGMKEDVKEEVGGAKEGKKKKKKGKKADWDEDFDMESELGRIDEGAKLEVTEETGKREEKKGESDKVEGASSVEVVKESSQEVVKESSQEVVKESSQEVVKESSQEVVKESSQEVVKESRGKKTKKGKKAKGGHQEEECEVALAELEIGPSSKSKEEPQATSVTKEALGATKEEPQAIKEEPQGDKSNEMEAQEEGDAGDKKKKKKKKSGASAAAEKPKKSTVGSAIKKRVEAMRVAQKQREEEERRMREEEERRETERLEKLRLEEERKMKLKQKEKERKERRKKEGTYFTKAERQKKMKQQAHLDALIAQGVNIPGLNQEAERKPVKYGSRRNKKNKEVEEVATSDDVITSEDKETTTIPREGKDEILDSWEDLDAEGDQGSNVKDTWDASSGEEGEGESEKERKESEATTEANSNKDASEAPTKVTELQASSLSEGESEEETSSSEESSSDEDECASITDRVANRIHKRKERALKNRSPEFLRCPVICVLGHVDTGKTKILDKIRHTNVQDGEAGGITQQIGATYVPDDAIRNQTKHLKEFSKQELKIPGFLIIDTPGHESFSNLRTRGSSLCDVAILVVDLMHGLEPQTIESINILKKGKVPFLVALNKVDRLLDWRRNPTSGIRENLKKQKATTTSQFDDRFRKAISDFAEQGINVSLFWEKVSSKDYVPVCPTSAITGDGMGDLMALLALVSQKQLQEKLMFSEELECHVLEVKALPGLGTTVDVILRNGMLKEGDTVVLCGSDGPYSTQIRTLLTPQPLRELRVKNAYIQHKELAAAQGVKLTGKELEKTLAGTPLFVAKQPDEVDYFKSVAAKYLEESLNAIKCQDVGVYVQASTLGSLEALVEFLKQSKIPYCAVNIGPVHKRDVMKASVMLEHKNDYAVILAFDVRVEREAQEYADQLGVKIFTADIIYHLFDNFMQYREDLKQRLREQHKDIAVFPCKLRILPNCIFNTRDPIVLGVQIEGGILKQGTPLTVPSKNFCDIGIVTSMELNHKPVESARKGSEICIKIEPVPGEAPRLYGRHFDHEDLLVSKITRRSIDAIKEYFREDLSKNDWHLMVELKKQFHIL